MGALTQTILIISGIISVSDTFYQRFIHLLPASSIKVVFNEKDYKSINSRDVILIQKEMENYYEEVSTTLFTSTGTFANTREAFNVCHYSQTLSNLFIITTTDAEFRSIMKNITEEARRFHAVRRKSFCRVFLFVSSCKAINETGNNNPLSEILSQSGFPFDWHSNIYLVQFCRGQVTQTHLHLWDFYSVSNKTPFLKYISSQSVKTEGKQSHVVFNLTEFYKAKMPKVIRRRNMQGINVTASAFLDLENVNDNEYEIRLEENKSGEYKLASGMSVDIFKDFECALNFTQNFLKIDLSVGFEKAFTSDEYPFDINLYHTGVTKNRTKVAKPLHPTYFDGLTAYVFGYGYLFLYRVHAMFIQPVDHSMQNIYRKPFAHRMWHALFFVWACLFVSCKLVEYLERKWKIDSNDDNPDEDKKSERIPVMTIFDVARENYSNYGSDRTPSPTSGGGTLSFEALLWCIGAICQQGWYNLPNSTSIRVIVISGLFLSVVSYSAYTGKIVSELWNVPKPIGSLQQLMLYARKVYLDDQSDTSYDVLEGLAATSPEIVGKTEFASIAVIYKKMVKNPGRACVITWPDAITSLVHGNDSSGGAGTDAFLCETIQSFSFQSASSLFVPKQSELEKLFNYRIVVGLERGFIRRYWKTFQRNTKLFCLETNPKVTTLDFAHVFLAFLILFSGMGCSVTALFAEVVIHRLFPRGPVVP